ncbi:MAG: hypothetical protein ACRDYE_11955 [Acidimicrobiales bacterium]
MTHVHSPDPNLIGCDVIWGGVPPPFCSTYDFHGVDVLLDTVGRGLTLPVHQDIVGVMVCEDAGPIGVIPSHEVELIHALKCLLLRARTRSLLVELLEYVAGLNQPNLLASSTRGGS